jgi:hypothetical protein
VYQAPTRGDFQRNVSVVIHEVRAKFKAENGRIISNLAARGLAGSGDLISDVVSCANRFHAEIIDRSMRLAGEFVGRSNLTPAELAQAVRPALENLTIEFLAPLITQRYPQPEGQRAMAQYTQVFQQRLEGALRDMQIGFIGGRNVAGQLEQTIQANAFELLKAIERTTRGSAEPAHLEELHNLHMTDGEAQADFIT